MKKTSKLFALLLALSLVALSFTGCFKQKPDAFVEDVLKGVQEYDEDTISTYFPDNDLESQLASGEGEDDLQLTDEQNATLKEIIKTMCTGMTYEIKETTQDGNSATVQVAITNKDLTAVMNAMLSEVFSAALASAFSSDEEMSDEALTTLMIDSIKKNLASDSISTVTTTVDLKLIYQDKAWTIQNRDELETAIMGGFNAETWAEGINQATESITS